MFSVNKLDKYIKIELSKLNWKSGCYTIINYNKDNLSCRVRCDCGKEYDMDVIYILKHKHKYCGTDCKLREGKLPAGCSFPDAAIFYYVKKYYEDAMYRRKDIIGLELDVYIPSINVAIEYDGSFYHNYYSLSDDKKNSFCKDKSITLIRVVEEDSENLYFENNILKYYDEDIHCVVRQKPYNYKSLDESIKFLLEREFGIKSFIVNTKRDKSVIIRTVEREFKFDKKCPELVKYWHPIKNNELKPNNVRYDSCEPVWWICDGGCEFYQSPNFVRVYGIPVQPEFCENYKIYHGCKKCIKACKDKLNSLKEGEMI